jgi:formate-dependent nitrite reductase cytochrome c552 subunit
LDKGGDNSYHQGYFWGDFQARNMKRKIKRTRVIGNLHFEYYLGLSNSMPYGDWNKISDLYNEQKQFQKSNKTKNLFKISIRDFIKGENQEFELKLAKHANDLWIEQLNKINASYTKR